MSIFEWKVGIGIIILIFAVEDKDFFVTPTTAMPTFFTPANCTSRQCTPTSCTLKSCTPTLCTTMLCTTMLCIECFMSELTVTCHMPTAAVGPKPVNSSRPTRFDKLIITVLIIAKVGMSLKINSDMLTGGCCFLLAKWQLPLHCNLKIGMSLSQIHSGMPS